MKVLQFPLKKEESNIISLDQRRRIPPALQKRLDRINSDKVVSIFDKAQKMIEPSNILLINFQDKKS